MNIKYVQIDGAHGSLRNKILDPGPISYKPVNKHNKKHLNILTSLHFSAFSVLFYKL